jgi:hypothetical protein
MNHFPPLKIPDGMAEIRRFHALVLWLNELFPSVTIYHGFPSIYRRRKQCHKSPYKTRRDSISIIVDGVNPAFFTRVVSPVVTEQYAALQLWRLDLCEIDVVVLNTRVLRQHSSRLFAAMDLENECLRLIEILGQEAPFGDFWHTGVTISCDVPLD